MPAAPNAPPAAAPAQNAPAGITIVPPSRPAKPVPPPTREIRLESGRDSGPPKPPPEPGSARDRLSQRLRAKASEPAAPPAAPKPAPPPPKPGTQNEPEPESPETRETPESPEAPEIPEMTDLEGAAKPKSPTDKKKINPWKILDEYKAKTAELEKKLSEAGALPQEKEKKFLTRIEELEKRNAHLEDEMRFVNYAESEEFKSKYQTPYEAAWKRAVAELSEITITDPSTQASRPATAQDLNDLLSVPLSKARELANQYFGDFADDIMGYRKEIKALFDSRAQALADAKKAGATREQERKEAQTKQETEFNDFISNTWKKVNEDMLAHEKYGKYFSPIDGDEDGNDRLAKGFAIVDRAFSETPRDPRLTPEQRAAVVKRHAAVRARAAAFGRLVASIQKLEAEKEALSKELSEYKQSTPPLAGSSGEGREGGSPMSPRDRILGELRKRAR